MQKWVRDYVKTLTGALKAEFGDRLLYVGLQGSCMRGEAGENSDIDIMAVLDSLSPADMDAYRRVVKSLEYADRSCGFLCGRGELAGWNRCEICHLLHTTLDCFGELSKLVPEYTRADVLAYVQIMTGNLYHALCHSRVHGFVPPQECGSALQEKTEGKEKATGMEADSGREADSAGKASWENMLPEAFKQAFFILQNKQYLESGCFAVSKAELWELVDGADEQVLKEAMGGQDSPAQQRFALLFDWCRQTLFWAEAAVCADRQKE